jgi:ABC-type glycerol-3-phosphate transport system permease component
MPEIESVEKVAQLADRYGMTLVLAVILLVVVLYILRLFIAGKLVPRDLLEKAEEDRDEAIKALHDLRVPLQELTSAVRNIKKDDRG